MSLRTGLLLVLCCSFWGCTRPLDVATTTHPTTQQPDAPQGLPDDFIENSAPPAPPNHDGGHERDAGIDLDTAIPFDLGEETGRIADQEDEDGWLLQGADRDIAHVRIANQSDEHTLHVRFMDDVYRDVVVPTAVTIAPGDVYDVRIEMPLGIAEHPILMILSGDGPLDYHVLRQIGASH